MEKYDHLYSKWIEMYRNGMSSRTIARTCGCNKSTVLEVMRAEGITRSVSDGSKLASVETREDCRYFDAVDCEEKAYWLGFLLADGCIRHNQKTRSYGVALKLAAKDVEHLVKFACIFNVPIRRDTRKDSHISYVCKVNSQYLAEKLISYGMYCRKTYVDGDELFNHIPSDLMNHFIRGIFDGDGCIGIYNYKGRMCYRFDILALRMISSRICSIMGNVGIKLGMRKPKGYNNDLWKVYAQSKSIIKEIGSYLYNNATLYLVRKKVIFDEIF